MFLYSNFTGKADIDLVIMSIFVFISSIFIFYLARLIKTRLDKIL
jgi:hypothetical protein